MTQTQLAEFKRDIEIVLARIEALPETYDQNYFCGTACCLAGHLRLLRIGPFPEFAGHHEYQMAVNRTGDLYGIPGADKRWIFQTAEAVEGAMESLTGEPFKVSPTTIRKAVEVWLKTDALRILEPDAA